MQAAGLFDAKREAIRRKMTTTGLVLLLAGGAAMLPAIALVNAVGGWGFLIGFSLMAVGVVGFVCAGVFSPQSDKAALARPRWQAFARFLKEAAKGQQPFVGAKTMEEYLPYAASLGLASEWASLFQKLGADEAFAWFRPIAAADGGSAAFAAFYAGTMTSSGGASAAGAGGGAAGGGSSGAS
jgi:uncharacterized membrane protein